MKDRKSGFFLSGRSYTYNDRGQRVDEDGFFTSTGTSRKPQPWPCCVSVKITDSNVQIRDTKDPAKTTLTFRRDEWDAFIEGAKKGEFDL